jgi:hypothetical protein
MVSNWEVPVYGRNGPAPDFVLICATGVPISPFSPVLPIEESITYLFSMAI